MAESLSKGKEDDQNIQIKYLREQLELRNSAYSILQQDNSAIKVRCEFLQGDLDEAKNCINMMIKLIEERDVELLRLNRLLAMKEKGQEPVPTGKKEGTAVQIGGGTSEKDDCKLEVGCSNLGASEVLDETLASDREMEMKAIYDRRGKAIEDQVDLNIGVNHLLDPSVLSQMLAQKESEIQMIDGKLAKSNQTFRKLEKMAQERIAELEKKALNLIESENSKHDRKGKRKIEEIQISSESDEEEEGEGEEEDEMYIPIAPIGKLIRKGRFGDRCMETGSSSKLDLGPGSEPIEELKIGEKRKDLDKTESNSERKREKKKKGWRCETDMLLDVVRIPQLLLEAVCVLYRLERSCSLMGQDSQQGLDPNDVEKYFIKLITSFK